MESHCGSLAIARAFAIALDNEDYAAAVALLGDGCVYAIHGKTHNGPDAIIATYKGNGDAAANSFDKIAYGSKVRAEGDGRAVVTFSDHIRHKGRTLDHYCEQWLTVGGGRIMRIEHRDLPGERERLEAFKRDVLG